MGAVLMIQGTSSDVGKSVLCAAVCRWLHEEGYSVAPFKAQNMALNAMVVPGGGEIGWAQVMQAEASCVEPGVLMNPVLLKPVSDTVCQVVVAGRPVGNMSAVEYQEYKRDVFGTVLDALASLRNDYDVVVIEGAGSPAEVNLRRQDIVNMGLAAAVDAPVLLAADIDRGGMFASVVGTLALLEDDERERVRGIIVNKFRGSKRRLRPGLVKLEKLTGKPVLGVLPYLESLSLPAEDSLALKNLQGRGGELDIAVVALPRIANFTDFHMLASDDAVNLRYVKSRDELGRPHLIILPGTKNTLADLAFLRQSGLAEGIREAWKRGCFLLGICGGYQLLGTKIHDTQGFDGTIGCSTGLGLLPVETEFSGIKTTTRTTGVAIADGERLEGYEIHMGQTRRFDVPPFARFRAEDGTEYLDGAVSVDGRILGTYLHGLFDSAGFRTAYLNRVRRSFGLTEQRGEAMSARERRNASYRLLAQSVREHLDTAILKGLVSSYTRQDGR